jgi:hypothetical protein
MRKLFVPSLQLFSLEDDGDCRVWAAFFKQFNAVVGLVEVPSKEGIGKVAFLKAWEYKMPINSNLGDFGDRLYNPPLFQVVGGPLCTGLWVKNKGFKVIEKVVFQYPAGMSEFTQFSVGSPFDRFRAKIEYCVRKICSVKKPKKFVYWQAANHPEDCRKQS